MKKLLSFFIVLAMLCGLLAVPASASGNGSLQMGLASGNRGDTVTLSVYLSSNPGLVTMTIRVSYDTSVLRLTNVSNPGLLVGAQLNTGYGSPYTISWVDGATTANNTQTGTIATFTFKILDNAKLGESIVTLQFVDSYDTDYRENSFTATSGKVIVTCSHTYGNWGDAGNDQHSRTCSVCSAKETASHTWNSGVITKIATCKDAGTKTYTCTTCNAIKTQSVAKLTTHSYAGACDADCNVCGATRIATHNYKTSWNSDQTDHWHECMDCKAKKDVAVHTPDGEATATTAQICTICGYEIAPALVEKESTEPSGITDATTPTVSVNQKDSGNNGYVVWVWVVIVVAVVSGIAALELVRKNSK